MQGLQRRRADPAGRVTGDRQQHLLHPRGDRALLGQQGDHANLFPLPHVPHVRDQPFRLPFEQATRQQIGRRLNGEKVRLPPLGHRLEFARLVGEFRDQLFQSFKEIRRPAGMTGGMLLNRVFVPGPDDHGIPVVFQHGGHDRRFLVIKQGQHETANFRHRGLFEQSDGRVTTHGRLVPQDRRPGADGLLHIAQRQRPETAIRGMGIPPGDRFGHRLGLDEQLQQLIQVVLEFLRRQRGFGLAQPDTRGPRHG